MIEELNKKLIHLELDKIVEILPDYIHENSKKEVALTDTLNYLCGEQIDHKNLKASEGIIRAANFPFKKTFEDYDFAFQPSVSEKQMKEIQTLNFLETNENIVFIGNSGVGKTHLAVSIGIEAAKHRKSVYFITCHNLMTKLNKAQKENRLDKQLQHLAQYRLLIIDEVGYLPVDKQGSNLLFQLIAKRYTNKSTIITTNMPFAKWGEVFSDNILANAMLDRLLHFSYIIRINGNSYRTKDIVSETDNRSNKYNE